MNLPMPDPFLGHHRCKQWTPLITQQLRLRHLYQIFAYNIETEVEEIIYYTLHQTAMSPPFFTSEKVPAKNAKFAELKLTEDFTLSASSFVLRIWLKNHSDDGLDSILLTWGIALSGLVHLGNNLADIQPEYFTANTLILHLRGGYFTDRNCVFVSGVKPLPFIDSLNLISTEENTCLYRITGYKRGKQTVRNTYNVEKLRKLRLLQIRLRNRTLDTEIMREKLTIKCGFGESVDVSCEEEESQTDNNSNIRYAPQLLTMNSLNKMLQIVPTKYQKHQIKIIQKDIEIAKSINRLLLQERDRKTVQVRILKDQYNKIVDDYDETNSQLMENMRQLSKDKEKLKERKLKQLLTRELLTEQNSQLSAVRRKLMLELLDIYPIVSNSDDKYFINGIYLPNSDTLSDVTDDSISVALGYTSHVLTMCEYFLQTPLRYPLSHRGSQSHIRDHIKPLNIIKDRDFPLFTRGKDRIQVYYAIYLLNKNIAQLRWLNGQNTQNLKATLPNLLGLLQGRERSEAASKVSSNYIPSIAEKETETQASCFQFALELVKSPVKSSDAGDPFLPSPSRRHHPLPSSLLSSTSSTGKSSSSSMQQHNSGSSSTSGSYRRSNGRRGSNAPPSAVAAEMLAVPEAFLNRQMSYASFVGYAEQLDRYTCGTDCSSVVSIPTSTSTCNTGAIPKRRGSNARTALSFSNTHSSSRSHHHRDYDYDDETIEQGTDILASSLGPPRDSESPDSSASRYRQPRTPAVNVTSAGSDVMRKERPQSHLSRGLSRSVDSYSVEDSAEATVAAMRTEISNFASCEIGSEPALNVSSDTDTAPLIPSTNGDHHYLDKWLESGPALICAEDHLYPDEVLGVATPTSSSSPSSLASVATTTTTTVTSQQDTASPLTIRADALNRTTKSFNLVKPKY